MMRCFYHRQIDALGICKHCGRGLCDECAVERPVGLACAHRCEEEVDLIGEIFARSRMTFNTNVWSMWVLILLCFVAGGIFVLVGIFDPKVRIVLISLGSALCASGGMFLLRILKDKRTRAEAKQETMSAAEP